MSFGFSWRCSRISFLDSGNTRRRPVHLVQRCTPHRSMLLRSAPPGCMCAIQHKLLPTAYAPYFGYRFRHCYSYMRLLAHLPSSLLDTRCYPTFPGACCLYLVRCAPEDCHPGCVTNIVTATDKCPSILLPLLNPSLYLTDAFAEPCLHSTHEPHDATTASVSADWFPPSQT